MRQLVSSKAQSHNRRRRNGLHCCLAKSACSTAHALRAARLHTATPPADTRAPHAPTDPHGDHRRAAAQWRQPDARSAFPTPGSAQPGIAVGPMGAHLLRWIGERTN